MCTRANDTAGKPADSTTETTVAGAPCPTCGGMGYHPSTDLLTLCGECKGTGIITSAIDIHANVDIDVSAIATILSLATKLGDPMHGDPMHGERGALRYAAMRLTVQAIAMVTAPRRPDDDPPTGRLRVESLYSASCELAALHAVLMDVGGETERAALEGAALIAGGIAGRMRRVEDELAALHSARDET